MAPTIHVGDRSYSLPAEADPQTVAESVRSAVEAKGMLELQIEVNDSPVTLFVNTAQVDVIGLSWHGSGAGFLHG